MTPRRLAAADKRKATFGEPEGEEIQLGFARYYLCC
jgi:hypothetical protein